MASSIKQRRKVLLLKMKLLLLKKKREIENLSRKRKIKDRRWWVHPIWKDRKNEGYFHTLLKKMVLHDHSYFHNFLRMTPEVFDKLESLLSSSLKKYPTSREPLSPAHRLTITLRFLATGESLMSTAYGFRIGKSTAHYVIKETCDALWTVLQPLYLPTPTTAIWKEAAKQFGRQWQYPNCCGAVDGKHVAIQQPAKTGSMFYNYKGTNSIVLMAVVDAGYKFLAVDIGAYGSSSDGGIFKSSDIGQALENGTLGLPGPSTLPRSNIQACHVLLGDEAFQLRADFLRPYPGRNLDSKKRVFNYRLSRARRCSENAFGLLGARWRVYQRTITMSPHNVDRIVKATVVLHNFLMAVENGQKKKNKVYCPSGYADFIDQHGTFNYGAWNEEPGNSFRDIPCAAARNSTYEAILTRQKYAEYFWSEEGQVPWQWEMPGVTNPRVE